MTSFKSQTELSMRLFKHTTIYGDAVFNVICFSGFVTAFSVWSFSLLIRYNCLCILDLTQNSYINIHKSLYMQTNVTTLESTRKNNK